MGYVLTIVIKYASAATMKPETKADMSTTDGSISCRNRVRIAFLEREKKETSSYISDLEATIAINKTIIQDLCAPKPKDAGYRAACARLNEENVALQRQVKELKRQRDDCLSKILILEQMVDEMKLKEREQANEWRETNAELLEQLNLKEYHLQVFEKRCNDAEALVLKYLRNVPEAIEAIGDVHNPVSERVGISNVVIQNKQMKAKMNDMTTEVNRLRKELCNSEARKLIEILKGKINGLVKDSEDQRQKLGGQVKINQELFELNEKLREQLSNLNKQVNMLMHSQRIMHAETVYTLRSKEPAPDVFFTQEVAAKKGNESFGELSSISMDEVGEKGTEKNEEGPEQEHIDINQLASGDIVTVNSKSQSAPQSEQKPPLQQEASAGCR